MFFPTPYDEKILPAYVPHFSKVWILPAPFLRPIALPLEQFNPRNYPTRNEILKDCHPVPWSEILSISSFKSLAEIDVALRSSVRGIRQPDERLISILHEVLEQFDLVPPANGIVAPHTERRFIERLCEHGNDDLVVYDEHGSTATRVKGALLLEEDLVPDHGIITTEDISFLLATHWDSCCSFVSTADDKDHFADFEKIACTPQTEVYWSLYPM